MLRIDLNTIDRAQFMITEHIIANEKVYLIIPQHIGCQWSEKNLIFRSSIWDKDGYPVSLGYKKFFNFNEQPTIYPFPDSLKNCSLIEKLDGSLLCVSKYKNELIIRTRGTISAYTQPNAHELEVLKKKYPLAFNPPNDCSYLYEWLSDTNKIVLSYPDCPDLYLIGCIHHHDYKMETQLQLDELAAVLEVKRPRRFTFKTIREMLDCVSEMDGIEGLCVYYKTENGLDQGIRKVKSASYLARHAFKSDMSLKNILDLYLEWEKPSYNEFIERINKEFDYECSIMSIPIVSKVIDASKEVAAILNGMRRFCEPLSGLSRKDAAAKILAAYGNSNRSGYCFGMLDNKEIDNQGFKKLIFQVIGEA